jgi:hypothetical protein
VSPTTVPPPAATANGNVAQEATFPVDSFRDAAPFLRRPFTPAAVKFKVQATWESGGLIVAYIDARLVVERLNLIAPHLWHDAYRPIGSGQMWCDLTVDGITRSDIGEGTGKGLVSDALKRAAVKFGIGVSLYATPSLILKNQHLKRKQGGSGKETVTINDDGMRVVRGTYADWLEAHGIAAFGRPLDHGDVDGAQGDTEADAPPPPVPAGVNPTTGEVQPTVDDEQADRLVGKLKALVDAKVWTGQNVKLNLAAAGATDTSSVKAAVATLLVKQATQLEGHVDALLAPVPA